MVGKSGIILFKEKQIRIIIALIDKSQEWHLANLAQAANATYVHTSKFITACESLGIVGVERHGKIKNIYLTEKGNEIAKSITNIMEKISVKKEEALENQNLVPKPA